jgi:hypothetical protein
MVRSRIGVDGVLGVTLPPGTHDAYQKVQVTAGPLAPKKPMVRADWAARLGTLHPKKGP